MPEQPRVIPISAARSHRDDLTGETTEQLYARVEGTVRELVDIHRASITKTDRIEQLNFTVDHLRSQRVSQRQHVAILSSLLAVAIDLLAQRPEAAS